jgi:hypothetical protein
MELGLAAREIAFVVKAVAGARCKSRWPDRGAGIEEKALNSKHEILNGRGEEEVRKMHHLLGLEFMIYDFEFQLEVQAVASVGGRTGGRGNGGWLGCRRIMFANCRPYPEKFCLCETARPGPICCYLA